MTGTGGRFLALGGVACAVSAAALGFAHDQSEMAAAALRRALGGTPGLTVGAIAVDPARHRASLSEVGLLRPGLRITLGRVEVPVPALSSAAIVGPALAQSGTASAENIRIETSSRVISIPRVEAQGTALSDTELAALFDPKDGASLADRLAKLSFEAMSAPEVTLLPAVVPAKAEDGRLTFHNVVLSKGVAGKIKDVTIERAEVDDSHAGTPARPVETGKITLSDVDLPLALRVESGTRTDADAPLLPLYDGVSIEAIRLRSPADGAIEIGSVHGLGFKGRPLLTSFAEASRITDKPAAERSESQRRQLGAYAADVISSFSSERVELRDLAFSGAKDGAPLGLKIGGFTIDGLKGTKLGSMAIKDVSLSTKDADISLTAAALNGFEEPGLPAFIRQQSVSPDASPSGSDLKVLGLKVVDASWRGLHVDVPVKDASGNSADGGRVIIDAPEFELRIPRYADDIPAELTVHMRTIYDVAPSAPADAMQTLVKAGFAHFDVATDYAMKRDEKAEVATIDRFSVDAKDMGSVTFGASFSHVTKGAFEGDAAAMQHAAQLIKVQSLDMGLINAGLAEKVLSLLAASSNTGVPLLKAEFIGQIDAALVQALGTGPVTDQLTTAITAFINTPKNLTVSIKAPAGLGLADLNAVAEPKDLLGLVQVSATANR